MKTKLIKVVIAVSVLMMTMVGCGQKEVSVSPTNVVEENAEAEISEGSQESIDKKQETSTSVSDFEFEEQDGEIVLVKYNGSAINVTIPDSYNEKNVTIIGDSAFYQNEVIEEVVLPETVIKIEEAAFQMCCNLKKITLSENMKSIEKEAFYMCSSLENINLADSIEEIGINAFANTALKEIKIPSGLEILKEGSFSLTFIEKVIIPSNIKKIENIVFDSCVNLVTVEMYEGVEYIGDSAFGNNELLSTVKIPESVTEIDVAAFLFSNNVSIIGKGGSVAEIYAKERDYVFKNE